MLRQQVGDLLEIELEGNFYYVLVLTKIVMFGGNLVFAFHGSGGRSTFEELTKDPQGFNVCTDLLYPKKHGNVARIGRIDDIESYFFTRYAKQSTSLDPKEKPSHWFIYDLQALDEAPKKVRFLSSAQRNAMDYATFSFDLVALKILSKYTPNQNPRLKSKWQIW